MIEITLAEVTRQAQVALAGSSDAAFVMQVPSGLIIATTPSASRLLDPTGGDIVGRPLEHYTADEPSGALALFAEGRINGYEATRTLARTDADDLRVSLWHKRFDHQSTSRFALVLITTSAPEGAEPPTVATGSALVVGAVSASLIVEQISSGTIDMFGQTAPRMLGLPVHTLVDPADSDKWRSATSEASTGTHLVALVVRPRWIGASAASVAASAPVTCDVLLLPLRPGFTFIFSTTDAATHPVDTGGVRSILVNLSRLAVLAQSERQRVSGLREQDLPGLSELTARERDMLTRLVSGYRVTSIAEDLVLSPSTVRTHLASIFAKLGVTNQNDLLDAVRSSRPGLGWSELYPSWHYDQVATCASAGVDRSD
jgi:DNA-binding CsgD family transcriptional regulator